MKKLLCLFIVTNSFLFAFSQPKEEISVTGKTTPPALISRDSLSLVLININEVGKLKSKFHPIIYFSGRQWAEFTKTAKWETYNPSRHDTAFAFNAIPIGANPSQAGVLFFAPPCPPGCRQQDAWGGCHDCQHPPIHFCDDHGTPGNNFCSGLCPGGKKCKLKLVSVNCRLIKVSCGCE